MITKFSDEYRWLSNFWLVEIEYEGLIYPSVENAYQASKTYPEYKHIFATVNPAKAKILGRTYVTTEYFTNNKLKIMYDLNKIKYSNNDYLKDLLLSTGTQELIEGNTWGDIYWGQCPVGFGQNNLGKILMIIREELKHDQS